MCQDTLIPQPWSSNRAEPTVFTTRRELNAGTSLWDGMPNFCYAFAAYEAHLSGTLLHLKSVGVPHHFFFREFLRLLSVDQLSHVLASCVVLQAISSSFTSFVYRSCYHILWYLFSFYATIFPPSLMYLAPTSPRKWERISPIYIVCTSCKVPR